MFIAAGHMISEAYLWLMDIYHQSRIFNSDYFLSKTGSDDRMGMASAALFSAGTWIYSLPCIRAEFP